MIIRTLTSSLFLFVLCQILGYGQNIQIKSGTYISYYKYDDNVTLYDAKRKAIENAKSRLLSDCFGVDNLSREVRGEWISDISEPAIDIWYDSSRQTIVYKVTVCGKVKDTRAYAESFDWKILRGGTEDSFESDNFFSGNHVYISFSTSLHGYLVIYLVGPKSTHCLLPYSGTNQDIFEVSAGHKYVFFDKDTDINAHRYKLKTDMKKEENEIHLIFSEKPFSKCLDVDSDSNRPNFISSGDFLKWERLASKLDTSMIISKKKITITTR